MVEGGENRASKSVAEWLDEIATRLILDRTPILSDNDLSCLSALATSEAQYAIVEHAASLRGRTVDHWNADLVTQLIAHVRMLLNGDEAMRHDPGLSAFSADPEMLAEFITEVREHLVAVEEKMLGIETVASDSKPDIESINAVFRAFHTIKGLAGFLELQSLQQVAHEVETLLDLARTGKLTVSPEVVDAVLDAVDFVRAMTLALELAPHGNPSQASASNATLLERIRNASRAAQDGPSETFPVAGAVGAGLSAGTSVHQSAEEPPLSAPPAAPQVGGPRTLPIERRTSDASSVRIETAKLDDLMNMVGEMVIAQTLISHSPALATVQDPRLLADIALLTRITSDVQKVTTSMRMVPIGMQFQKTARLVRDLSRQEGKQVALVTSGEETELDKAIAEELADPMMHMVRNAIDHGIEKPVDRGLSGKPAIAQIKLAAYHQSGQIVIEISDDGRGLDREKILAKANERGLVRPGSALSDSEVFLMIFEPGFSTAEAVTGISGRGVGMDVVKKHVQKLRGRIDIQSEPGKGATFFLKLPLTLAIIEGLIVVVGESRYIIPIFSIIEMLRPSEDLLSTVQSKGEMALIRGSLLPIVRLHERFKITPRSEVLTEGMLVVCESQGKQFCLFVDDLVGKQEVVIKGLGETFKDVRGLAGCAILGDGRVGLILDVEGIFRGRP